MPEIEEGAIPTRLSVGDRVILARNSWFDAKGNPTWGGKHGHVMGTVTRAESSGIDGMMRVFTYHVNWDDPCTGAYYRDEHLEVYDA